LTEEPDFDLDGLDGLVEQTLTGDEGEQALQCLIEQLEVLSSRIPDNPFGAVRADVFPATQRLVIAALRLANEFREREDLTREETALRLRSNAVCKTYGHHRHHVGPAMLEWAGCHQRMGNHGAVEQIHQAIVKDFAELLNWGGTDAVARIGLECLQTALEGSTETDWDLLVKTREALEKCEA
jgi:cation transport regulator ChaB